MTCCNQETREHGLVDLANIVPTLRELGYHAKLTDQGVVTGIAFSDDSGTRNFAVLITEDGEDSFQFNCQIGTIGELEKNHSDESLSALAWVLLSLNSEIQPWSVALINPDGQLDPSDTIVLTDSLQYMTHRDLASAMASLERALAAVVPAYV